MFDPNKQAAAHAEVTFSITNSREPRTESDFDEDPSAKEQQTWNETDENIAQ